MKRVCYGQKKDASVRSYCYQPNTEAKHCNAGNTIAVTPKTISDQKCVRKTLRKHNLLRTKLSFEVQFQVFCT